eukprot:3757910-Pleurochrysis_carterae.AAC.1
MERFSCNVRDVRSNACVVNPLDTIFLRRNLWDLSERLIIVAVLSNCHINLCMLAFVSFGRHLRTGLNRFHSARLWHRGMQTTGYASKH